MAEVTEEEKMRIQAMIDELVERAKKASEEGFPFPGSLFSAQAGQPQ